MSVTNDAVTPLELAKELSRTPQSVSRWIHDGIRGVVLPSERIGGRVLIRRSAYQKWQAEVAALMKQRRPRKETAKRSKR